MAPASAASTPAHEVDTSLAADVLLENLACKMTAVLAMRTLLAQLPIDPMDIPYVLNSGEGSGGRPLPARRR